MKERILALKENSEEKKQMLLTAVPLIVLILLIIFFEIVSRGRLISRMNIGALLNSMFFIALGATGVSFLMAQGNLDFFLGGIVGLSATLAGFAAWINPVLSVVVVIGTGAACGLLNGVVHAKLKVAAIITTLSTAFIFRGIQGTLIASGAVSLPPGMMFLENTPLKVTLMVSAFAMGAVFYNKTRVGKYCKAIGSGEEAAFQSGIKVDKYKICSFMFSGAVAGIVGFFYLTRAASASANTGSGFEFDVLLAMLLGGMPISGGAGARFRSVIIGSLIMTILSNGMILWGLDLVLQQFIRGIIFLISVSVSFDRRNLVTIV